MTTDDSGSPPPSAPQPSTVRHRWLRLIIGLIVVNVVVLAGILVWSFPRFERVEIDDPDPPPTVATSQAGPVGTDVDPGDTVDEPVVEGDGDQPGDVPPAGSGSLEPVTFLVMGSDSRENLPQDLGVTDRVVGQRADVVMIVTLEEGRIRLLSLPRDLRVEIGGTTHKLNAAYAIEGPNPQLLYDTVQDETGIDLDYYIELDFAGFAGVVDELGGVDITFPYAARDLKSHLNVAAGLQHLDGRTALAYARSRQYEENRNGAWVPVEGNDLGRIGRQQSLLFAMLGAFKDLSLFDVNRLLGVLGALERHIRVDSRLSDLRMIELLTGARGFERDDIEVVTLPLFEATEDGVSYLVAAQPEADEVYRSFQSAGSLHAPGAKEPMVLKVLNGNGASGEATKWGDELRESGFTVLHVDDAGFFDFSETVVTVRPDDFVRGEAIIDVLGFGRVEPGTLHEELDAVVIIGTDALGR